MTRLVVSACNRHLVQPSSPFCLPFATTCYPWAGACPTGPGSPGCVFWEIFRRTDWGCAMHCGGQVRNANHGKGCIFHRLSRQCNMTLHVDKGAKFGRHGPGNFCKALWDLSKWGVPAQPLWQVGSLGQ